MLYYQYTLGNVLILRWDCITDLVVHTDSQLYFHQHDDFTFSRAITLPGLSRTITFSFYTIDSLLMLYFFLVRYKPGFASAV
jgi:hypothetical protein